MNTSRWLSVGRWLSLALGGCATSPEEDPVQIRMNDLDARVQRIERVLTNQSLLELAQRIDALQADLRTIRGEVELLQNQSEGGKTQTRNLYGDLEKRLAALETLGGVGACRRRRRGAAAGAAWRGASASRPATTPALTRCKRRQLRQGDRRRSANFVTTYPTSDAREQRAVLARRELLHQGRSRKRHHGVRRR